METFGRNGRGSGVRVWAIAKEDCANGRGCFYYNQRKPKQSPAANIANALTGRLPGLVSVQRSGEPGNDGPELFIRGRSTLNSNAPLITIDGVEKAPDVVDLLALDPNEVESVTILKDASATALYGVKGANGVIIIKTRRGKEGKPRINTSVQTSVQEATRIPKYLDSYHFALLANEAYKNDNLNSALMPYSAEALKAYESGSDPISIRMLTG